MRFKKFEKPHKNAKFQAKRAVMKQDETVKTQILRMLTCKALLKCVLSCAS